MPVELECDSCGHRHEMGTRTFDEEAKRMTCPECGTYPFTVHREGLGWHPSSER